MPESSTIDPWWRTLGRVLLFFLSCAVVLATASRWTPKFHSGWSAFAMGAIAALGALVLTLLFVRWEGLRLEDVGVMPGRQSLPRFAIGFLIGLFLAALRSALIGVSGHVRWARVPDIGFAAAVMPLLIYLVLACREELAFHGYPLRSLDRSIGLWGAQLIVAGIFALEHMAGGVTWVHAFLGAGIGSLLFGMASLATRGLAMPIGLHAAWNYGQWMLGGKESSGMWQLIIEKGFESRVELAGTISYLVVMSLAILAFWWYWRVQKIRRSNPAPVSVLLDG